MKQTGNLYCLIHSRSNGKEFRKLLSQTINQRSDSSDGELSPSILSSPQDPPPRKKTKIKVKKFRWTPSMVGELINCLNEQKSQYEFKGLDFEADLVKLYRDIRVMMAEKYENGSFGPVSQRELPEDLTLNELTQEKFLLEKERKAIKTGYDQIKTKCKEIRQNYRKAVTEGSRSGSGKIVCDNWESLKSIWGGSPATKAITNAISSYDVEYSAEEEEETDKEDQQKEKEDFEENEEDGHDIDNDYLCNDTKKPSDTVVNPTPKFVDNKRKNMEKPELCTF